MAETNSGRALHYSSGKPGVDQIPVEVLLELGQVYTYGEEKYARRNWLNGNDWHEFYGSALRHIFAYWSGEDFDPDSQLPHLSHAIWNLVALRYFQIAGIGVDDREVFDPWYPDYGLPENVEYKSEPLWSKESLVMGYDDDPSDPGPPDDVYDSFLEGHSGTWAQESAYHRRNPNA